MLEGLLLPIPPPYIWWHSLPIGFAKLNFDRLLINSLAANEFITRDWTGRLLNAGSTHYGFTTILVAKARGMHSGLNAAIQAGCHHIIVESDNKIVIHALEGKSRYHGRYTIL